MVGLGLVVKIQNMAAKPGITETKYIDVIDNELDYPIEVEMVWPLFEEEHPLLGETYKGNAPYREHLVSVPAKSKFKFPTPLELIFSSKGFGEPNLVVRTNAIDWEHLRETGIPKVAEPRVIEWKDLKPHSNISVIF